MHYFLGLEVWQNPSEIFLSQGKYIMKLLERFGIVDCKSVTTPMELNFKKLCESVARPDLGNPSEYRQLMGALIFFGELPSGHTFCSEYIESVYGRASSHTLDCCQESFEISLGRNPLWTKIHRQGFEATWIYRR